MGDKAIYFLVDEKIKHKVELLGLRHKGVYLRGIDFIEQGNIYQPQIAELQKKVQRLSNMLEHYARRGYELEDKIKELQAKNKGRKK